jgi:hypothetical protein
MLNFTALSISIVNHVDVDGSMISSNINLWKVSSNLSAMIYADLYPRFLILTFLLLIASSVLFAMCGRSQDLIPVFLV